jgi:hypothetical protein
MVGDTAQKSDEPVWPSRRVRRYLLWGLVLTFLATIGGFLVLVARGTEPNTLLFEGAKTLSQLALVVVIGAALSLLTFEYQQRRKEEEQERDEQRRGEEYRQELLKSTLTQATASYTQVKRVRRLMRVALTDGGRFIVTSDYDKQMRAIIDAQLQFENLAHDVETGAAVFTSQRDLKEILDCMEDHLSDLISEYEEKRPGFSGERPRVPLDELPRLDNFLAPYDPENPQRFRAGFEPLKTGFVSAQKLIRDDLLPLDGRRGTRRPPNAEPGPPARPGR